MAQVTEQNNMDRATILPFPGDPLLLHYWLSLFDKYWKNEITTLYIYLNSTIEKEAVDYIKRLCARYPQIVLFYNPIQTDHGPAINNVLDSVKEKYIMLIEDDGFIFKSGIVDGYFRLLESGQYDVIGSKRGSCHTEILKRAMVVWGLQYDGFGDQGPNFWPNFFFCSKELLLKTDRNFAGKAWKKGEIIEALGNYVVQNDIVYSDTFVNTSLQIRAMVPANRILCINQYHGHPDDVENYEKRAPYTPFDGQAGWCHIGSLSSGVGGILTDDQGRSLTRRLLDPPKADDTLPKYCNTDFEKREFERRVQWWLTFYEKREENELIEFSNEYIKAVRRIIYQYKLSIKNVYRRQKIYALLGL